MASPLRIGLNAQLLSRRQGYRAAGISRHIANLIDALERRDGPERIHAFVGPDGGDPELGPAGPVRWHRTVLPTARPAARILWEQAIAPLEAARRRLDLWHGPAYAVSPAMPCRSVVTFHDLSFERLPHLFHRSNRLYLGAAGRISAARAARVIAVSEWTRRELVELFGVPEDRVIVIPNGVEESFQPLGEDVVARFRREKGLPEHFILYLGTLEPRKNIGTLIHAYQRLSRAGVPLDLVLAGGKGWLYESVFAEVESLGLSGRVHFPGFVPFAEQPLWYNAAAVFAYPSHYEGFGLPPLESMACGTPVVCSNSTSLPEVVGDAGLTVDPLDDVALANALTRVIEDRALSARLEAAGLERARLFRWDDVAARTLAVYHEAAN